MRGKLICLLCIVFVSSLILAGAARGGLVGWWRLEEGTGTSVTDSSDSGNDGTFSGNPQWVAGKVGGGLQFDGGDSVSVPGAANIKPPSLTLMTWVNFDNVSQTATREDYLSRGDDYAFSLHEDNADGKIHGIVTSAGGWSVVDGKTTCACQAAVGPPCSGGIRVESSLKRRACGTGVVGGRLAFTCSAGRKSKNRRPEMIHG